MLPDSLRHRLSALRAMTVQNGCTEAEAATAAEMAARIMRDHGLEAVDLDFGAAEVALSERLVKLSALWVRVGLVTGCFTYQIRSGRRYAICYTGKPPGPELAQYLHVVISRALATGLRTWQQTSVGYRRRRLDRTRRQDSADVLAGMAERLRQRLTDFVDEAQLAAVDAADAYVSGCTSLKPVRSKQLVCDHRTAAARDGIGAAEQVTLLRPISGAPPQRLGRS